MAHNDYVSYMTIRDDRPASVTVNLSLASRLRDNVLPVFNVLSIIMLRPNFQGLSSPDEFDVGVLFEDRLIEQADGNRMEYAGRETTNGRWQYCFYCESGYDWEVLLHQVLRDDQEYECRMQRRLEPKHETYETLCPRHPHEIFQVLNAGVIDQLRASGVDLALPHEVRHSLKMPPSSTEAAIKLLREWPSLAEFAIQAEGGTLTLTSRAVVTLASINTQTVDAIRCTNQLGGEYLGCEVSHS